MHQKPKQPIASNNHKISTVNNPSLQDPHELVRKLFLNNEFNDLIKYNLSLQTQIAQSDEDVRGVIGQRYRELLDTCGMVVGMEKVCLEIKQDALEARRSSRSFLKISEEAKKNQGNAIEFLITGQALSTTTSLLDRDAKILQLAVTLLKEQILRFEYYLEVISSRHLTINDANYVYSPVYETSATLHHILVRVALELLDASRDHRCRHNEASKSGDVSSNNKCVIPDDTLQYLDVLLHDTLLDKIPLQLKEMMKNDIVSAAHLAKTMSSSDLSSASDPAIIDADGRDVRNLSTHLPSSSNHIKSGLTNYGELNSVEKRVQNLILQINTDIHIALSILTWTTSTVGSIKPLTAASFTGDKPKSTNPLHMFGKDALQKLIELYIDALSYRTEKVSKNTLVDDSALYTTEVTLYAYQSILFYVYSLSNPSSDSTSLEFDELTPRKRNFNDPVAVLSSSIFSLDDLIALCRTCKDNGSDKDKHRSKLSPVSATANPTDLLNVTISSTSVLDNKLNETLNSTLDPAEEPILPTLSDREFFDFLTKQVCGFGACQLSSRGFATRPQPPTQSPMSTASENSYTMTHSLQRLINILLFAASPFAIRDIFESVGVSYGGLLYSRGIFVLDKALFAPESNGTFDSIVNAITKQLTGGLSESPNRDCRIRDDSIAGGGWSYLSPIREGNLPLMTGETPQNELSLQNCSLNKKDDINTFQGLKARICRLISSFLPERWSTDFQQLFDNLQSNVGEQIGCDGGKSRNKRKGGVLKTIDQLVDFERVLFLNSPLFSFSISLQPSGSLPFFNSARWTGHINASITYQTTLLIKQAAKRVKKSWKESITATTNLYESHLWEQERSNQVPIVAVSDTVEDREKMLVELVIQRRRLNITNIKAVDRNMAHNRGFGTKVGGTVETTANQMLLDLAVALKTNRARQQRILIEYQESSVSKPTSTQGVTPFAGKPTAMQQVQLIKEEEMLLKKVAFHKHVKSLVNIIHVLQKRQVKGNVGTESKDNEIERIINIELMGSQGVGGILGMIVEDVATLKETIMVGTVNEEKCSDREPSDKSRCLAFAVAPLIDVLYTLSTEWDITQSGKSQSSPSVTSSERMLSTFSNGLKAPFASCFVDIIDHLKVQFEKSLKLAWTEGLLLKCTLSSPAPTPKLLKNLARLPHYMATTKEANYPKDTKGRPQKLVSVDTQSLSSFLFRNNILWAQESENSNPSIMYPYRCTQKVQEALWDFETRAAALLVSSVTVPSNAYISYHNTLPSILCNMVLLEPLFRSIQGIIVQCAEAILAEGQAASQRKFECLIPCVSVSGQSRHPQGPVKGKGEKSGGGWSDEEELNLSSDEDEKKVKNDVPDTFGDNSDSDENEGYQMGTAPNAVKPHYLYGCCEEYYIQLAFDLAFLEKCVNLRGTTMNPDWKAKVKQITSAAESNVDRVTWSLAKSRWLPAVDTVYRQSALMLAFGGEAPVSTHASYKPLISSAQSIAITSEVERFTLLPIALPSNMNAVQSGLSSGGNNDDTSHSYTHYQGSNIALGSDGSPSMKNEAPTIASAASTLKSLWGGWRNTSS